VEAGLKAALCLVELGKNNQAEKLLREVAKSENPGLEAQAFHALGEIYFQSAETASDTDTRGDLYQKALQNYLKVDILYQASPVRPDTIMRIGDIWHRRGNREEAAKEYRRVISEYPDSEQAKTAAKRVNF